MAINDHGNGALDRQGFRYGRADTGAAARYDKDLILQVQIHLMAFTFVRKIEGPLSTRSRRSDDQSRAARRRKCRHRRMRMKAGVVLVPTELNEAVSGIPA